MAFFITDWMSRVEKSFDLIELAFVTQKLPSFGTKFSHGSDFVAWKSSSQVSARKVPTFSRIRSVVRRKILARAMASASPMKLTRPSVTSVMS